jgi:polysaccharide pyruvyl transferase WcaK-like protein
MQIPAAVLMVVARFHPAVVSAEEKPTLTLASSNG